MDHAEKLILNEFWKKLAEPEKSVLLLDYDGTLAPFKTDRDQAFPYPGVREIVSKIIRSETTVVMVTGRSADEMLRLLDVDPPPEVFGSHGLERVHPDGRLERYPLSNATETGIRSARSFLQKLSLEERIEEKYGCLAFHWRDLKKEEVDRLKDTILPEFERISSDYMLDMKYFDGGIEFRAAGHGKGKVVKTVIGEHEEAVVYAYLGDDLTDEDAFKVLKGKGLTVLIREMRRETAAQVRLKPPDELLWFLNEWHRIRTE